MAIEADDSQLGQEEKKVAEPSIPVASAVDSSKPFTISTSTADKPKLSGAELKKQKQAEKAARRAKVIEKKGEEASAARVVPTREKESSTKTSLSAEKDKGKPEQIVGSDRVRPSSEGKNKQAKVQHHERSSQPLAAQKNGAISFNSVQNEVLPWSHLSRSRRGSGFGTKEDMMDIHQDVRIMGLKMETYDILGSNPRLVATLIVLKNVISDYETPENQALTRHLIPQVLNRQIGHLVSCRPLSVSQGNAIRWLKLQISKIDVNMPEKEAKALLCTRIDEFIRDKSTLAHQVIAEKAAEKIKDGDVVLTYGKSVVVEKTIRKAWADGKRFMLNIIDTRPWGEGLKMAESLSRGDELKGIRIGFGAYNAVSHLIDRSTKVLLGAHAMMSNGCLYSRVGTAGVALEAHTTHIPVIVLCESVKFSDKAPLTTWDMNELAPVSEMIPKTGRDLEPNFYAKPPEERTEGHRLLKGTLEENYSDLEGGVKAINPMYDLTPASYINMVISEHGVVPPTSVPVLHRLYNEANEEE